MDTTEVLITLSAEQLKYLGPDYEATIYKLLEKEATRRFYIERSKPKPPTPPLTFEQHLYRDRKKRLTTTYSKLMKFRGADFNEVHGDDYRKLTKALVESDIETLRWFEEQKPWQSAERNSRFSGNLILP